MAHSAGFEIGIFTFGELTTDADGSALDPRARLRDILEWARVADDAGLDVFGVGEHHREDFAISSPQVVLASAAAQTTRIRLTSTVTVLSSADPVRAFEDFATLDLVSRGRAELTAGRGAYLESFPLFGQELERYDECPRCRRCQLASARRVAQCTIHLRPVRRSSPSASTTSRRLRP